MKEVKLTKKEQALLATFKRPYSVNEIVSKIDVITQNLLKYMYEDISAGADLIEEESTRVIPDHDLDMRVRNIVLGGGKDGENLYVDSKEIEHIPEQELTEKDHHIRWLRFNHGTAMVGMDIDGIHYIHKKFFDAFKDKPRVALEGYTFEGRHRKRFVGDDFPRDTMEDHVEIDRIGDWVVCTYSADSKYTKKYFANQKPNFKGYDHWVN